MPVGAALKESTQSGARGWPRTETRDLGRQVQELLADASNVPILDELPFRDAADDELGVSSSAQQLITERLVTFSSIAVRRRARCTRRQPRMPAALTRQVWRALPARCRTAQELQQRNAQLLATVRRLTEEAEAAEREQVSAAVAKAEAEARRAYEVRHAARR